MSHSHPSESTSKRSKSSEEPRYYGSYSPVRSPSTRSVSNSNQSLNDLPLTHHLGIVQEQYGIEERRDGHFDPSFINLGSPFRTDYIFSHQDIHRPDHRKTPESVNTPDEISHSPKDILPSLPRDDSNISGHHVVDAESSTSQQEAHSRKKVTIKEPGFYQPPSSQTAPPLSESPSEQQQSSIPNQENPPEADDSPKTILSRVKSFFSSLINQMKTKLNERTRRRINKCVLASFLASLLALIIPIQAAIGQAPFLAVTGIIFFHPARTLGAQIELTITGILGIIFGSVWCLAGLASATAYNQMLNSDNDSPVGGRAILIVFLFTLMFISTYIRIRLPRFFVAGVSACIVGIFALTRDPQPTTFEPVLVSSFAIPLVLGAAIALFINITVYPESASQGLGRALEESLRDARILLKMTVATFLLDPEAVTQPMETFEKAATQMRSSLAKLSTAYVEARYEISYGYAPPRDFKDAKNILATLTKHLASLGLSLKNEKFLLEARRASMLNKEAGPDSSRYEEESEMIRKAALAVEALRNQEDLANVDEESDDAEVDATNENTDETKDQEEASSPSPFQIFRSLLSHKSQHSPHVGTPKQDSTPSTPSNEENNQSTIQSIASFLRLPSGASSPVHLEPPPAAPKEIYFGDRRLLIAYLEGVREPLTQLGVCCGDMLGKLEKDITILFDIPFKESEEEKIEVKEEEEEKEEEKNDENIKGEKTKSAQESNTEDGRTNLRLGDFWKKLVGKKDADNNVPASTSAPNHNHKNLSSEPVDNVRLVREAISRFDEEERARLYQLKRDPSFRQFDLGHREEVFLVFFFMFSLREIAKELANFAETIKNVKEKNGFVLNDQQSAAAAESNSNTTGDAPTTTAAAKNDGRPKWRKHIFWPSSKIRKWIKLGNYRITLDRGGYTADHYKEEDESSSRHPDPPNTSHPPSVAAPSSSSEPLINNSHAMDAHRDWPIFTRIEHFLWYNFHALNSYNVRFSTKMAVAITILALPAYIDSTMAWYATDKGQWACLTVLIVLAPSVGGTINTGLLRVVGTLAGAAWGAATWAINGPNPYVLSVMEIILAYPMWYVFLYTSYNKVGSVTIITYIAVNLNVYVNPNSGQSVEDLIVKRTLTMLLGIVIAFLLNWFVWPFVARHELRKSVAHCVRELGDLYSSMVSSFVYYDPYYPPTEEDATVFAKRERKVQEKITKLSGLLALTSNEPRMKGPFPEKIWKAIITNVQNLLDRMVSMRVAAMSVPSDIQEEMLSQINTYRRDMVASILLYFYVLSSALKAKDPLPPYLPSARIARIRLINKIRESIRFMPVTGGAALEYRNMFWYSYMSVVEEVIEELENLGALVKTITGESEGVHANLMIPFTNSSEADPSGENTFWDMNSNRMVIINNDNMSMNRRVGMDSREV